MVGVTTRDCTLAEAAARSVAERGDARKIRIQIGSARCENAAGAGDVLDGFRKPLAASGRNDIALHRVGCTGRCSGEPVVNVLISGLMPAKYPRVERDKVQKIFTGHVLSGQRVRHAKALAAGGPAHCDATD